MRGQIKFPRGKKEIFVKEGVNKMKRNLQKMTAIVMAFAMIITLTACQNVEKEGQQSTGTVENGAVIGEGSKTFTVEVTDGEGKVTTFTVKSDEQTVGAALLALEVIAGEEGAYGLYVKTVNGVTADYDKDQSWWGFYVDGISAMTGVDSTDITEGSTYGFKVEK